MAISSVRSYFRNRMLEAVSDAVEHKIAISFDNTSVNLKNKTFFIEYQNNNNIETHGNRVTDEIEVTVIFLFKAYRYTQASYDELSDLMHDYKLRCSNISRYETGIKRVVGNTMLIEEIDETNDNILQCTLTFTVRYDNDVI
mgnify:CR=1 FL=1